MKTKLISLLSLSATAAVLAVGSTPSTRAQSPEEKGYQIAALSDRSDNGFGDSSVNLKMILRTAAGKNSSRELEIKTLERTNEKVGDKSLVIFSSPADIDGTALLSHAKLLKADDQWLYLPALKRVKRISSKNKSGPFVGSEFAFEDFTSLELGKFGYKFLRTEDYTGLRCDVVERIPKYKYSGYTKQVGWFDQKDHQLRKIEFYDRKSSLMKTLQLTGYKKYQGKFWRAQKLMMKNHQTGKSTEFVYGDYKFDTGLSDRHFVNSALKRTR